MNKMNARHAGLLLLLDLILALASLTGAPAVLAATPAGGGSSDYQPPAFVRPNYAYQVVRSHATPQPADAMVVRPRPVPTPRRKLQAPHAMPVVPQASSVVPRPVPAPRPRTR